MGCPPELVGQVVVCPHCGNQVRLSDEIPPLPSEDTADSSSPAALNGPLPAAPPPKNTRTGHKLKLLWASSVFALICVFVIGLVAGSHWAERRQSMAARRSEGPFVSTRSVEANSGSSVPQQQPREYSPTDLIQAQEHSLSAKTISSLQIRIAELQKQNGDMESTINLLRGRARDDTAVKRLEERIKELEQRTAILSTIPVDSTNPFSVAAAADWKRVQVLQGTYLYAQDTEKTFLGILDFTGTHPDSIFNPVGLHGSKVGLESIWSDVGFFGSPVGMHSARNPVCIEPPVIVSNRKVIGHVTVNQVVLSPARVDPDYLRFLARRIQGR